jgi:hypothetical protein
MEGNHCCYSVSRGAHLQGDAEERPCLSRLFKDQSWTNLGLQVSVNFHFVLLASIYENVNHILGGFPICCYQPSNLKLPN